MRLAAGRDARLPRVFESYYDNQVRVTSDELLGH